MNKKIPDPFESLISAYTRYCIFKKNDGNTSFFSDPTSSIFEAVGQSALTYTPYRIDIPYTHLPDILSVANAGYLGEDIQLPFERTWVTLPRNDDEVAGVMLRRSGRNAFFARACIAYKNIELAEPHPAYSPSLKRKLGAIKDGALINIFPEIHIDPAASGRDYFEICNKNDFVIFYEDTADHNMQMGRSGPIDEELLRHEKGLIAMALIISGIIAKKSILFPAIVDKAPVLPPVDVSRMLLKLGKKPRIQSRAVRIDLDYIKTRIAVTGASTKQKSRHWVGAYTYFKPSLGRPVSVPEHERCRASSPEQAPIKPRAVHAAHEKKLEK